MSFFRPLPDSLRCWGAGVLLFAVAWGWQWFLAARAAVPVPDCTRYVRMARTCQAQGLLAALIQHEDQPLFPVLIAGAEPLVRPVHPGPQRWLIAAQGVAALSAALAMVVLWRLFGLLWSSGIAWLAALLVALLPVVARMGADGVADPVALLFWLLALWSGCRAAAAVHKPGVFFPNRRIAVWMLLGGISTALAWSCSRLYFALLVLPGAVGVGKARQFGRWQTWRSLALASASFGLGVVLIMGAWLSHLRPAPAPAALGQVLGWPPQSWPLEPAAEKTKPQQRQLARLFRWRTSDGRKMAFWKKDPLHSIRTQSAGLFVLRFGRQLGQAFHYLPALLALVGVWSFWRAEGPYSRHLRHMELHRFLAVVWLLQLGFSFGGTWHLRYVSDRHLVPLAVLSLGWSVLGAIAVARRLQPAAEQVLAALGPRGLSARWRENRWQVGFAAIIVVVIASCLLKWRRAPQSNYLAHRQAAQWISRHVAPESRLLDTRGWSELFTGCKTYLLANGRQALADPLLEFVVVERRELQSASRRGRTLREVLQQAGRLVRVFPAPRGRVDRDVLVFAWSPEQFVQHYRRRTRPRAPRSPGGSLPVTNVSHKHSPRAKSQSSPNTPLPATGPPDRAAGTTSHDFDTLEQPAQR